MTRATDRTVRPGELFLIDSGAQYPDGTTDITRTVAVGAPERAEMRDRFTRVLKGHVAIARAVFPAGTTGAQIDAFARAPLWQAGLDFDHGTGHGVGAFLSVHEGPQRIAKTGTVALEPGMILSNEPGYYSPRRLRHPDREPRPGRAARHRGRRAPDARLRDADARPVRPAADPAGPARPRASAPGSTPTTRGCATTLAPGLDAETRDWLERATAPLAGLRPDAPGSPVAALIRAGHGPDHRAIDFDRHRPLPA